MTKTATLETVITEVHRQSANHFDEIVPVREMAFDGLNQMWVSGRRVEILPSAQRLLSNRLRVPFSYLSRCPAELQAKNLNYWIEQEREQRETFFCRFDGDRLRAVFTERYTAIDHMEVLTKILEYGFDPAGEVQFALDSEMMVLKMPEYDRTFRLSGDDKIIPGISIANSRGGNPGSLHRGVLLPPGLHQRADRQNCRGCPLQAHLTQGHGRVSPGPGRCHQPVPPGA